MLFQLQLSGTGLRDCQEWVVSTLSLKVEVLSMIYSKYYLQCIATSAKLNDIVDGVVQNINQLCQCGLSAERITESTSEQQVTF